MIPDFKTYIKESTWGDMRRRSTGEIIRTEDDIDNFDRDGLVDYLKQNYKCEDEDLTIIPTDANGRGIYINLYEDIDSGYDIYLMYDNIDEDRRLYVSAGFETSANYVYNEMCKEYTLTIIEDEDPDGHPLGNIRIEPKGCRYENLTNTFFIQVLNFIIERIEEPLEKQIEKK